MQVFLAGGVPEVMLHLRDLGLLNLDVLTVTGEKLGAVLDWWKDSDRRRAARARLRDSEGVDPDHVIMSADGARRAGLTSTVVFPAGNIAPEGSVVKATAIDPQRRRRRPGLPPPRPGARLRERARRDRRDQGCGLAMRRRSRPTT